MKRRMLANVLLAAVLAMQAFVGSTAAYATSVHESASIPANHCGGQATHDPGPCSCCPDGASMAGCLYLCAAYAVTAAPSTAMPLMAVSAAVGSDSRLEPLQTYPPPDPPPIA